MTEDELLRLAEEAMQELEYQEEYGGDPGAGRYADVIFGLLELRREALEQLKEREIELSLFGAG